MVLRLLTRIAEIHTEPSLTPNDNILTQIITLHNAFRPDMTERRPYFDQTIAITNSSESNAA